MELLKQIKDDQLEARKAKEQVKSSLLTTLIGDIENAVKSASKALTDLDILSIIKRYLKANAEFKNANPNPLVLMALELEEVILNSYMPKQLTQEELTAKCAEIGLTTLPAIMKYFKENHAGQYDGALLSKIAKEIVNNDKPS
jgi:uncharacterized protein YqeY